MWFGILTQRHLSSFWFGHTSPQDMEAYNTVRNLLLGRADPYMFHQANMRVYTDSRGKQSSLLTAWIDAVTEDIVEVCVVCAVWVCFLTGEVSLQVPSHFFTYTAGRGPPPLRALVLFPFTGWRLCGSGRVKGERTPELGG